MSQDGKGQLIPKDIKVNEPSKRWKPCPCGGEFYASPTSKFAKCSNGEVRCTNCFRPAKKFGRGGLGCGPGCHEIAEAIHGTSKSQ